MLKRPKLAPILLLAALLSVTGQLGIFKSTDHGDSWVPVNEGLPLFGGGLALRLGVLRAALLRLGRRFADGGLQTLQCFLRGGAGGRCAAHLSVRGWYYLRVGFANDRIGGQSKKKGTHEEILI